MSPATDERESRQPDHRRFRFVLKICFVAFCLAVCYVLLSAPLLLYSAHHPGSSTAQMVDAYMRPLLWADALLTPDFEATDGGYKKPLLTKVLYWYYGLWSVEVEDQFARLRLDHLLGSLPEPDPYYHYP